MENDSPLGAFIGLAMLGGMFFLGKKSGHNQAMQEVTEMAQNDKIKQLERQIEQLKRQIT